MEARNVLEVTMRNCLVTGAGRGIGFAIAKRLADSGNRVALTGRDKRRLDCAASVLPGPTLSVSADVTVQAEIDDLFTVFEDEWGPVEVLVLNAGTASSAPLADTADSDWRCALDTNLTAPFRFLRRAVPSMLERGWGRIVVVASMAAKRGDPYVSAYTASKHGVLGLVRSAAAELARSGITVNAVCPGYVVTDMTDDTIATISQKTGRTPEQARAALEAKQPIGRLITPEEVAEAVEFSLRNAAMTGQTINVDGGAVQS